MLDATSHGKAQQEALSDKREKTPESTPEWYTNLTEVHNDSKQASSNFANAKTLLGGDEKKGAEKAITGLFKSIKLPTVRSFNAFFCGYYFYYLEVTTIAILYNFGVFAAQKRLKIHSK